MRRSTQVIVRAMCVALVTVLLGCPHVPTQSGALATIEDPAVTAMQLKLRVYATASQVNAVIETAADSIRAKGALPTVRERALLWKLSAIPAVEEASLETDPTVAAVDLWAFSVQQRNYFGTGDGRDAFGSFEHIAIAAADTIEGVVRALIAGIRTTNTIAPAADARVEAWAAQHPIYGPAMHRESVLASDWQALGVHSQSLGSAVARVEQSLTDANQRLGYMNEGLLDRVTWQAQLAASTAPVTDRLDTLAGDVSIAMRRIAVFATGAPSRFEEERRELFAAIDGERARVFESITAQRVAIADDLRTGRQAVFDDLRRERVATLVQADSITQQSIDRADAAARRLARDVALLAGLADRPRRRRRRCRRHSRQQTEGRARLTVGAAVRWLLGGAAVRSLLGAAAVRCLRGVALRLFSTFCSSTL